MWFYLNWTVKIAKNYDAAPYNSVPEDYKPNEPSRYFPVFPPREQEEDSDCLLYTSDAADE